jgi:hypothetical protein
LLASSEVNNAKRLREKMEKKKEKMMMMMTLSLSDLEEWKSSKARNTNKIPPKQKAKKRNSIDALEAALCYYQISERKKMW